MWRDASAAKRIMSTALIAKFGATKTFAAGRGSMSRSGARSKPVVPITMCTPACRQASALASAVSGRVKSTTTSASPSSCASVVPSSGSARPASRMSSAPSTAATTACPIRPAAPATTTRITR